MEVINPIIIAGSKQQASANTFCDPYVMIGNYTQKMPIMNYEEVLTVSGPVLYFLRPGDYTPGNGEVNTDLLMQYGYEYGSIKRMFLAGNMQINGTSRYLNFCGTYDRSKSSDYVRGFYYVEEHCFERSVIIRPVNNNRAALPLTPMYAAFGETGTLTRNQLITNWYDYTTFNLYFLLLEE